MNGGTPLFDSQLVEGREPPLTVTQLNERVCFVLEDEFSNITITGEISSFKRHYSGHLYFELKDEKSRISAAMFRRSAAQLSFEPSDGIEVVAEGTVTVYKPQGRYQIIITKMRPVGIGELERKFRALKEKLEKEGLFALERKKSLPFLPRTVGIATSLSGAAIRDILRIITARNPRQNIVIRPTIVQGKAAPADIVSAIKELDAIAQVDVIIVGRGGGSYEDLFVFSDEAIARTIADAKTPIISAVGHESDFTISDFVADLRAATPTDAAQKAVPDLFEVQDSLQVLKLRFEQNVTMRLAAAAETLKHFERGLKLAGPLQQLRNNQQRIDEISTRLALAVKTKLDLERGKLELCEGKLSALSPLKVLDRGYSIVRKGEDVVASAQRLTKGDNVEITFAQGSAGARIQWTRKDKQRGV